MKHLVVEGLVGVDLLVEGLSFMRKAFAVIKRNIGVVEGVVLVFNLFSVISYNTTILLYIYNNNNNN